jgi:hypothetical protein
MTQNNVNTHPRSGGPNPGVVALLTLALTVIGIFVGLAMSGGAALSSPFGTTSDAVLARVQEFWLPIRISAWIQAGAAVPLGIVTATLYARQQRLGVRVPGPAIGLFGGILASIMLMVSGLVSWVLSRTDISMGADLAHALTYLSFITGSVGFVLGVGLLIAGVAVPALILRLVPRWLTWTGLVIAVCSELSFLAMVIEPLQFLFPIGRFGGLLWLVIVGFLLPKTRKTEQS